MTDNNNSNSADASSEKKANNDSTDSSIKKKANKHGKYLYLKHPCLSHNHSLDFSRIENWPVTTDAACEELVTMFQTHSVNPIPAYNMHGYLIHPLSYRKQLAGATVELHFELSHWSMKGRNGEASCDTYAADIVAICVLAPPKPILVTLCKCKVFDKLDPFASPSPCKKAHLMTL